MFLPFCGSNLRLKRASGYSYLLCMLSISKSFWPFHGHILCCCSREGIREKKNRHWRDFSGTCGCLWLQRKKWVSKYQLLCTLWGFESRLRDPLASVAAEVIVVWRPVSGKLAFEGWPGYIVTGISVHSSKLDSSSKFVKLVAAWRWW
jgi:hypothetical protein